MAFIIIGTDSDSVTRAFKSLYPSHSTIYCVYFLRITQYIVFYFCLISGLCQNVGKSVGKSWSKTKLANFYFKFLSIVRFVFTVECSFFYFFAIALMQQLLLSIFQNLNVNIYIADNLISVK